MIFINNEERLIISESNDEGYRKTIRSGGWCVANLNYAEKFKEENLKYLERHIYTDEVFVLLEGKATLLIGKEKTRIEMEQYKLYAVKKNVWHNIIIDEKSKLIIVENDNTGRDNTQYFYF